MSQNPYKILGVSPDADDEEIKRAYRALARKYHPDRHKDSDLAELAGEKMKEINAAYEEIQRLRAGQANGGAFAKSAHTGGYSGDVNSKFVLIRNCINAGNISEAARLLNEVDPMDRAGEWHFLHGCVLMRRGEYVDAQHAFDTACQMDPTNAEYRQFREELRMRANRFGGEYRTTGAGGLDLCTTLLCADCCCKCMGGDLVPCC